ncbi:helix-turn-helix transcriptional regulator [Hydrogenophaga intermedia]|uniref:helix-turn-helix transcriptional regulator n=1 Tax=Hydrogenophaga intermedia TaxID=65786 RepID=UPI00204347E8|nr:AraC family transcriptional regulator [Hydrogenophaga intermedia]
MIESRMEFTVGSKASPILANMRHGWQMQPAFAWEGTEQDGFGAALWHQPRGGSHEVTAEPDPHWHVISIAQNDFEVEARKGAATVVRGPVRAGAVQIMQAGVKPWAHHMGSFSLLHLYVSRRFVARVMDDACHGGSSEIELLDPHCATDPGMALLGNHILREMRSPQALHRVRLETLMLKVAVALVCRHSSAAKRFATASRSGAGRLSPHKLSVCTDYMQAHLTEDITLERLASQAGLSPYHFCRAFKESVGTTPYQWLIAKRIETAQRLLANESVSIGDVAFDTGFNSASHFATAFRKAVGVSPSAFRQQLSRHHP